MGGYCYFNWVVRKGIPEKALWGQRHQEWEVISHAATERKMLKITNTKEIRSYLIYLRNTKDLYNWREVKTKKVEEKEIREIFCI